VHWRWYLVLRNTNILKRWPFRGNCGACELTLCTAHPINKQRKRTEASEDHEVT